MKQDVLVFSDAGKTRVAVMAEKMAASETELRFCVRDVADKSALETICKDVEATRIITYGQYDSDTLQVEEIKKYAQYTALSYMGTQYGQVTGIDYSTEDDTSESGFAEQTADITEIRLQKKSYVQRQLDALKAGGEGTGPAPGQEPHIPTLEEVQEAKVAEMETMQQAAIEAGINVALTDGTVEHFTLTDHDQTSLMGLQSQVLAGEQNIPWHTSNEAEHCKFYSNADMALITAAAMACVTWHVTYFRDLRIYIRSLAAKEAVEAVTYGMDIPAEYRSEPLQAMLAAQNA